MAVDAAYIPAQWGRPPSLGIGPAAWEALGGANLIAALGTAGTSSAVWPLANVMIAYPFSVSQPITAAKMWVINGAVVSGNIDLGIYDAAGNRLVSKGSTAQAGTSVMQILDTTDLVLVPGQYYYAAMSCDNITATTRSFSVATAGKYAALGIVQATSAFPLPSTATFAATAQAYLPQFGLSQLVTF